MAQDRRGTWVRVGFREASGGGTGMEWRGRARSGRRWWARGAGSEAGWLAGWLGGCQGGPEDCSAAYLAHEFRGRGSVASGRTRGVGGGAAGLETEPERAGRRAQGAAHGSAAAVGRTDGETDGRTDGRSGAPAAGGTDPPAPPGPSTHAAWHKLSSRDSARLLVSSLLVLSVLGSPCREPPKG